MNQRDHSLLDKMHIKSDAIIGNQCDFNLVENFDYKGYNVKFLNFAEKGVGLNRNNALMRATGDICLFADDDMIYVDNYVEIVRAAFQRRPDADVIAFNLKESRITRHVVNKSYKVGCFNYLRFGTARIAVRLKSVREKGIYFNQCFGGGTEHCHGEDSIFLTDCLKKGLKMYAEPDYIAELTEERDSTWNKGYTDKYFRDQGALYRMISPKCWKLLCIQDAFRHKKKYGRTFFEIMNSNRSMKSTNGLYFKINDLGSNLSLGERQLLCFARSILKRSRIVILDEATASLDKKTENIIQKVIDTHFKACTVISIVHKVNSVKNCDRVLVMDGGKVAEFDSPEKLLKKKGLFAKLYYENLRGMKNV